MVPPCVISLILCCLLHQFSRLPEVLIISHLFCFPSSVPFFMFTSLFEIDFCWYHCLLLFGLGYLSFHLWWSSCLWSAVKCGYFYSLFDVSALSVSYSIQLFAHRNSVFHPCRDALYDMAFVLVLVVFSVVGYITFPLYWCGVLLCFIYICRVVYKWIMMRHGFIYGILYYVQAFS